MLMQTIKQIMYDKPVFPMSEYRLRSYCHDETGEKVDPFQVRLVSAIEKYDDWRLQFYFKWPSDKANKVRIIHNHDSFNQRDPKNINKRIIIEKSVYLDTNTVILSDIVDEKDFNGSGEMVFLDKEDTQVMRLFYHIDFFKRMPLNYRLQVSMFDQIKHQNVIIKTYIRLKKWLFKDKYTLIIDYPKLKSSLEFKTNLDDQEFLLDNQKNQFKRRVKITPEKKLLLTFIDNINEDYYYFNNQTPIARKKRVFRSKRKMISDICPYCLEPMKDLPKGRIRHSKAYNVHNKDKHIDLTDTDKKNKKQRHYYCDTKINTGGITVTVKRIINPAYIKLPTIRIVVGGYTNSGKSVNLSRMFGFLNFKDNNKNVDVMNRIGDLMVKKGIAIDYQRFTSLTKDQVNEDRDIQSYFAYNYMYGANHTLMENTATYSDYGVTPPFEAVFASKFLIHAYDFAGENFTVIDAKSKTPITQLLNHSQGLFWHYDNTTGDLTDLSRSFQNYKDVVGSEKKINIAILWTKYDVHIQKMSTSSMLNHVNIYKLMKQAKGKYQGSQLEKLIELSSMEVEKEIMKTTNGALLVKTLNEIADKGGQICYFNISAIGHNLIKENSVNFETQAYRLELPVIWLLGQLGYL